MIPTSLSPAAGGAVDNGSPDLAVCGVRAAGVHYCSHDPEIRAQECACFQTRLACPSTLCSAMKSSPAAELLQCCSCSACWQTGAKMGACQALEKVMATAGQEARTDLSTGLSQNHGSSYQYQMRRQSRGAADVRPQLRRVSQPVLGRESQQNKLAACFVSMVLFQGFLLALFRWRPGCLRLAALPAAKYSIHSCWENRWDSPRNNVATYCVVQAAPGCYGLAAPRVAPTIRVAEVVGKASRNTAVSVQAARECCRSAAPPATCSTIQMAPCLCASPVKTSGLVRNQGVGFLCFGGV